MLTMVASDASSERSYSKLKLISLVQASH